MCVASDFFWRPPSTLFIKILTDGNIFCVNFGDNYSVILFSKKINFSTFSDGCLLRVNFSTFSDGCLLEVNFMRFIDKMFLVVFLMKR